MEHLSGVFSGATLGLMLVTYFYLIKTFNTVNSLNARVNLLLKQQGIDVVQLGAAQAQELMRAGKKIEAIKVYREATGAGLAEAKAAVERLPVG